MKKISIQQVCYCFWFDNILSTYFTHVCYILKMIFLLFYFQFQSWIFYIATRSIAHFISDICVYLCLCVEKLSLILSNLCEYLSFWKFSPLNSFIFIHIVVFCFISFAISLFVCVFRFISFYFTFFFI